MSLPVPTHDPLIGTSIDGRYRVCGVLGRGGMGVVYDGLHEQLGRPVAIKVLSAGIASEPSAVERFLREARTASSLTHGNVVDVSDLGTLPDGRPYLVMPKMQGQDLCSLLEQAGPLPPARVVQLLRGAAAALDVIHAKGYVHRDVKPENLMQVVHEDGSESVRLLDFGIVALVAHQANRITAAGVVFGTPAYLAPELLHQAEPEPRSDVYSLAAVAFELLTRRMPFEDKLPMHLMQRKANEDAPSINRVSDRKFSRAIEQVIARGLARDPRARYGSAGAFVQALEEAVEASQEAIDGRPRAEESPTTSSPLSEERRFAPAARAARRGAWVAAALGLSLGAALAWKFGSSEGDERAAAERPVAPRTQGQLRPEQPGTSKPARESTAPEGQTSAVSSGTLAATAGRDAKASETGAQAQAKAAPAPKQPGKKDALASAKPPKPVPAQAESAVAHETRAAREKQPSADSVPPATADVKALLKQAAQELLRGHLDRADKLYQEATRAAPQDTAAWRGLGLTSERLGRKEAAITAFRRALQLAPRGAQADSIRARLQKLEALP